MSPIHLKIPGKGDDIATVLSKIILGSLIVKGLAKSSKQYQFIWALFFVIYCKITKIISLIKKTQLITIMALTVK